MLSFDAYRSLSLLASFSESNEKAFVRFVESYRFKYYVPKVRRDQYARGACGQLFVLFMSSSILWCHPTRDLVPMCACVQKLWMQETSKRGVSEYRALFVYDKICKDIHPRTLFEENGAKNRLTSNTLEKIALMFDDEKDIIDTELSEEEEEAGSLLDPDYWLKYGDITTRGLFAEGDDLAEQQ